MKRSIEFPCDKRWIRNPTNSPLATMGQRMATAARTKKAIAAVQAILSAHFRRPPMTCAAEGEVSGRLLDPNHWMVRLTRISPGTLDPLTGGASMKAIQDAVARWCGVPDERNPIWTWVEPIGQEKRGQGVYGVRIEIESLEPGEDRVIRLAGVEPRIPKGERSRPTVGDLRAAAERVLSKPRASDGCHERPEIVRALDQLGRSPDPTPSMRRCMLDELAEKGGVTRPHKPPADPGEERAACMLVPCVTCGAVVGEPCKTLRGYHAASKARYGVHTLRAQAAGIHDPVGTRREPKPTAPTGPRKFATVRPVECYARLPWVPPCATCKGRPDADVEIDGQALPGLCGDCEGLGVRPVRWTAVEMTAPVEVAFPLEERRHAWGEVCKTCAGCGSTRIDRIVDGRPLAGSVDACLRCQGHGRVLRMIRRPWRRAGVMCWLYEPAT